MEDEVVAHHDMEEPASDNEGQVDVTVNHDGRRVLPTSILPSHLPPQFLPEIFRQSSPIPPQPPFPVLVRH